MPAKEEKQQSQLSLEKKYLARESFDSVKKRTGEVVKFDIDKIAVAICKAGEATGEFDMTIARRLARKVVDFLDRHLMQSTFQR